MFLSISAKLLLLFAGHALFDYPLQGDFLARGKNRKYAVPGVPWYHCLFAHALMHAAIVYLITQNIWFALAELVIHAVTDFMKCEGLISFNTDQAIHYACKALWAIL